MWLTDLAKLADPKYGLTVKFEDGWKRRGASGGDPMRAVLGVLWHHDVAPRTGTYPLRGMLRDGRKGLTGPLCHIGFDRDGVVHVVGAGKANHAGTGSVPGVVRNGGNTRLIGIEMTSAGTRPWDWTDAQLRQMPKLGAALNDIFGLTAAKHWAHYEYSNGGKIDPAGLPGAMPGLRSRIAAVRFLSGVPAGGASVPSKPAASKGKIDEDGRLGRETVKAIQRILNASPKTKRKLTIDGRLGPDSYRSLQEYLGHPVVDGLIEHQSYKPAELGNGVGPHGWEYEGRGAEGSKTIRRLQQKLGVTADGVLYEGTTLAWQRAINAGKF